MEAPKTELFCVKTACLVRKRLLVFAVATLCAATIVIGGMNKINHDSFRRTADETKQLMMGLFQEPAVTHDNDTLRYSTRGILVDGSLTSATNKFNVSWRFLRTVGFPANTEKMIPASVDNVDSFVFVTGASQNHLRECLGSISTVQQYFSSYTLYFYDLDDNTPPSTVSQLQRLCNVVYRKFDFSRYPTHVRELRTYAFKPIIVHEMLLDHPGAFWIDSSARIMNSSLNSVRQQLLNQSRGVLMFDTAVHSIFEATHPNTYNYFPISLSAAVRSTMMSANAIYIRCSQELYESVFRWWFLCALDEACIAPTRNLACKFKGRDQYAGCHRFDQAAINILLTNFHNGDSTKFSAPHSKVVDIARGDVKNKPLCALMTDGTSVIINSTTIGNL